MQASIIFSSLPFLYVFKICCPRLLSTKAACSPPLFSRIYSVHTEKLNREIISLNDQRVQKILLLPAKTTFKFTRSGKNSQASYFWVPVFARSLNAGRPSPLDHRLRRIGTRLGDKHPTRFRRVQGQVYFEEIPSSVQDSEILGSWMRIKHKWKAMGSASYPEAGKGRQRECILPMVPCGSSPVARLYLVKNEATEEKAAMGWCKLHHPWK